MIPTTVRAKVGDRVEMKCTRTDRTTGFDWRYAPTENATKINLIEDGILQDEKDGRYTKRNDNNTNFTLCISNVQICDGGWYTCIDDAGLGNSSFAVLIVKGKRFIYCKVLNCYKLF